MFENFFAYYKDARIQEPPNPYESGDLILDGPSRLRMALPPDVMAMMMCTTCLDPIGPNPTVYYRLIRQEIQRLWEEDSPNRNAHMPILYDGENRMPEPAEFLFWLLVEYLHYLYNTRKD